jgi:hypothetical protein
LVLVCGVQNGMGKMGVPSHEMALPNGVKHIQGARRKPLEQRGFVASVIALQGEDDVTSPVWAQPDSLAVHVSYHGGPHHRFVAVHVNALCEQGSRWQATSQSAEQHDQAPGRKHSMA